MSRMISGKSYTLSHIFSGKNDKIVIPDLQRDYCWGNQDNNLVKPFVESLLELDRTQNVTMGLIYGYYDLFTEEHMQLCDGQQRLTTLFLLTGVLNRLLDFGKLDQYLMSDFERNDDDKEPYLQYAIRESSLYFLSDLTFYYFLKKGINDPQEIKDQPWYLSDYELDPTVQSMINAIGTIETILSNRTKKDLESFASFILNKIEFLFYDMKNRENGEETFVVINTTGEPLSPTQNLKPLMIGNDKNNAELWEEMETWFWRNRRLDTDYPHTSDEGMECFLNVVRILHATTEEQAYDSIEAKDPFPYKDICFNEVYGWFQIYKSLYEMDFSLRHDPQLVYPKDQQFYTQNQLYAIVPSMAYCAKFKNIDSESIKRIYHLFVNIARYRDVSRYKDDKGAFRSRLFRAVQLIRNMPDSDYLSLKDGLGIKEENPMFEMVSANISDSIYSRSNVEILLSEVESSKIFNGRAETFVRWSDMNVESFKMYWDKFQKVWSPTQSYDLLRRVLLTRNLPNYPISRKGYGNLLSLCAQDDDWYQLITNNSDGIKALLDDPRTLDEQINDFSDTENVYYDIIKNPDYVTFSEYKNLYRYRNFIIVMKKERTNSDYKIIINHTAFEKDLASAGLKKWSGWMGLWQYNEQCLFTDNYYFNLTLQCDFTDTGYIVKVWRGKNPERKQYTQFSELGQMGLSLVNDDSWEMNIISNATVAKETMMNIAFNINKNLLNSLYPNFSWDNLLNTSAMENNET